MRLKRVKISGFKTFADRTEFELDGALTSVVGPNGCGKSNLVDAILWGLGEGNARHLRAQSGVDVIFSGSSRRKPIGLAEVCLHFDNEDGQLPVPTSEVVISRKLNRAGESEYAINRQTCRLRDVLELLADSGLGRAGYAIVGQKEIDSALAASADERRAWVDEAAGVQRYRSKKLESQRRIASAREHLVRVADILRELEAQREPLEAEAAVAAKYKSAVAALKEIESGLLMQELANASVDLATIEEKRVQSKSLIERSSAETAKLEAELASVGARISSTESEMDSLRASLQGAHTMQERAEADLRVAEQKLLAFESLQSSLFEEQQGSQARISEIEQEIQRLAAEVEFETANFETVASSLSGAKDDAVALQKQLEELEARIATARRAESDRIRREEEFKVSRARTLEIEEELAGIDAALPDLEEGCAQAELALAEAKTRLEDTAAQIAASAREYEDFGKQIRQVEEQARKLASDRAFLDGRRRGIAATLDSHDGLAQGARAVLDAAEQGLLKGTFTTIAEAIAVESGIVTAIEAALGPAAHDLIAGSESEAREAIEYLKQNSMGRATFHLRSPSSAGSHSVVPEQVPAPEGVVGRAASLVACAKQDRAIVEWLLGDTMVCDNLDTALRVVKVGGCSRAVTLDGELVHASGAMTGGTSGSPENGLLHRKSELAELEKRVGQLDKGIAALAHKAETLMNAESKAAASLSELKLVKEERVTESDDAAKWLSAVKEELLSAQRAAQRLKNELEALASREVPAEPWSEVSIEELEQLRAEAVRAFALKSADAEQAAARISEAETRAKVANERLDGAVRRLEAARSADRNRQTKLSSIDPERARVRKEIERSKVQLKTACEKREQLEASLRLAADSRAEMLEASHKMSEDLRSLRLESQAAAEAGHQAEISWAKAEARRANAAERLLEEYGVSMHEAIERAPMVELPADAASLGARLRREIRAMGEVNVGAIEAYDRVSARIQELSDQKQDIEAGIGEIEESISELDKLTRARFESTFEEVRQAFAALFQRLFPGGSGDLVLTNPGSTLESGIEVDVQLPGKRRQRLELLSGGERALCATAFLFSLLKVKPSPLVVLDEVDAPLDGRNVEKFIDLLKEFASTIQFIVITHNRTTIGECPVWLGITMNEPGVSTLVPVRVRAKSEAAMLA